MLEHLAPDAHEPVRFDVDRNKVTSTRLVSHPAPLVEAPPDDEEPPSSSEISSLPIGAACPVRAISLPHVALPIPVDDPLYGAHTDDSDETLPLGDLSFQGERGLPLFPADWMMRLRFDPFDDDLEERALDRVEAPRADARGPRGIRTRSGSRARLQR